MGDTKLTAEAGLQIRSDVTNNSELSHTRNRYTLLNRIKLGDTTETSISPYISETLKFNEHFSIDVGLRFDQFFHKYNNKFADDSELSGIGIYKANANILSPKLNFYYHVDNNLQFYLTTGKGFHSNDTRAVVAQNGVQVLPAAYGRRFRNCFQICEKCTHQCSRLVHLSVAGICIWGRWRFSKFQRQNPTERFRLFRTL